MGKITAIIPAAGKGKRMGSELNKQFLLLKEVPILARTLQTFANNPFIYDIIVVSSAEEIDYCRKLISEFNLKKINHLVTGGSERQQSVYNGLQHCDNDTEIVLIHDGARPLITTELINDTISSARQYGAVSVAVPVKDTVKVVNQEGFVSSTPDRNSLWLIQTPQAFNFNLIKRAHDVALKNKYQATDDAGLVENIGHPVRLVNGSYENIKITTMEDLLIAETILARRQEK